MLGRLENWRELDEEGALVWALQRVGLMPERVARHRSLGIPDHRWAAVRHSLSMVAAKAGIGIGTFIAPFAAVQPMVRSGYSVLGEGACLGPNAVLREGITVGAYAVAGVGSAVTKDVPPRSAVMGNPARPVRTFRRTPEGGMRARVAGASRGVAEI